MFFGKRRRFVQPASPNPFYAAWRHRVGWVKPMKHGGFVKG